MNPGSLFRCPRRVGFLFPHACERLTPIGCPDCNNGVIDDPYRSRSDRRGYSDNDYDSYNSNQTSGWSGASAATPVFGGGDSGGGGATSDFSGDFTEADGESLTTSDTDFEGDLSAS